MPELPHGARAARRAPLVPALVSADEGLWRDQREGIRRLECGVRKALMAAGLLPQRGGDRSRRRAFFSEWAAQVRPLDFDKVPPALRGVEPPALDRDALASTPFAFRDGSPETTAQRRPRPQRTSYRPRRISDILHQWAIDEIEAWFRGWAADMARNVDFDVEMVAGLGPDEREDFLKRWRKWRTPLCLGQDAFLDDAQGIVWDVRARTKDGYYVPLDYDAARCTHLGLEYLRTFFARSRDKDMVAQLCETGVRFDAEVPLQICLMPHLISLPLGYKRVDKELHRLASDECGYVEWLRWMPFLPNRSIMQGAVARKLEPDRPRRISDAGCWRHPLCDYEGVDFIPLNTAIAAKSALKVSDDSDELMAYAYNNGRVVTTGTLGDGACELSPSTRPHTKVPPEIKPRLEDVMHDCVVLKHLGEVFQLPLIAISHDFKDFFNQFELAPWELWKVGFPWVRAADAARARDSGTAPQFAWVHERSLGFGYENASNFAQRVAWAIMEEMARRMDELDVDFFANTGAMTEPQRALVEVRRALSARSGRQELRLFSCAHMYTDDPCVLVLGTTRMVRFLGLWHDFIEGGRWRMAIAAKAQVGSHITWNGIIHVPQLSLAVIPREKVSRACVELVRVRERDPTLVLREYNALSGLLQSLLPWANAQRDSMFHWYCVNRALGADAGPSDRVAFHISDDVVDRAAFWLERLAHHPGIHCANVFRTTLLAPSPESTSWYMYVDAALEEEYGGLGGYMHGAGWYVPLEAEDRVGPYKLPITVLEYACYYATIEMQCPRVPATKYNDIVLASDSLGSVDAMIDMRSKSGLMLLITSIIRESDVFQAVQERLFVQHVYGAGNVFADAKSRGRRDVVEQLSAQLGIEYTELVVPPRVLALLGAVRARHRLMVDIAMKKRPSSDVEAFRGKRRRNNDAGDGKQRPLSNTESFRGKARRSNDAGDGKDSDDDSSDGEPPPAKRDAAPAAARRPHAGSQGSGGSDESPPPPKTPPKQRKVRVVDDDSPESGSEPPVPKSATSSPGSARTPEPTPSSSGARQPPGGSSAKDERTPRERVSAIDRDELRPCSLGDLVEELCSEHDDSRWALRPISTTMLRTLAGKGDAYAASAIPEGTLGVDACGWRRWKSFLNECFVRADPWRRDPAVLRGDAGALRREATLQALFYVWVYAGIRPRARSRKKGKPRSALNVVAAVRRIHRRARFPMPPCPLLAEMLKGMNDEYVALHGDRRFLLPSRKEPLSNTQCAAILGVANGTRLPGAGVVDWDAPKWVTFRAMLTSMRATGWRKADALSTGRLGTFDLNRTDVSWFIRPSPGAPCELTPLIPPGHVLTDGECAVLNPGGSKNDHTGEEFGTQPMYIPFMSNDITNAPLALQRMEALVPCEHARRLSTPLFGLGDGTPLEPDDADCMFHELAVFALGAPVAAKISLHSCRVWLACALLACEADDPLIQAMARWKTAESVHIYGRLNPQTYAQWLRRAAAANTTSQQVTSLPWLDDDDAHATLPEAIAALQHGDIEATCDPPSDSEDDDADSADARPPADSRSPVAGGSHSPPRRRRPAVPMDVRIRVQQDNPKRPGSLSFRRFEAYKAATTKGELISLGGTSSDFSHDVDRGFIVVLDPPAPPTG